MNGRAPPPPRQRGLALPSSLLLLGWLALLLAASQRSVALQWRLSAWQVERLQAGEDALSAMAAARQWLRAGGYRLPPRDCAAARPATSAPVICRQPPTGLLQPPWPQGIGQGIDGCAGSCGFHVQELPAAEEAPRGWRSYRLSAYGGTRNPVVWQLDLLLQLRDPAPPRCWLHSWRRLP